MAASVLSGNRNFEARIHPSIKTNFLMSPPLVVAFALAGRVDIDFQTEPLGTDRSGKPVFLKDLWPSSGEIAGSRRQIPQSGSVPGTIHHHAGQKSTLGRRVCAGGLRLPVE